MIIRNMQKHLPTLARGFLVITITGPRQSGKTTLAKMAFPKHKYIDLENLTLRQRAIDDPMSLFSAKTANYIIDEFQYAPQILSVIKTIVDANQIEGQFVLTGSNQFALMKDVSQSLAGRTAIFELLPLCQEEAYPEGIPSLDGMLLKGFYPRPIVKDLNIGVYYDSYIRTYLQRDVRLLSNVQNIDAFMRFLSLCAGRIGSILNKESLANDAGVDAKTIANWLSILQSSYIIYLLRPWHSNISKRLIKSPKLYFYDTGLACKLLNIRNENDLVNHHLRGGIFENLVIIETMKHYLNSGCQPPLHFYRESSGMEIDLIIEQANQLIPVEVKSSATFNTSMFQNLQKFHKLGLNTTSGMVVYSGDESWRNPVGRIVSFRDYPAMLQTLSLL